MPKSEVSFEWYGDEIQADIKRASDAALDASASTVTNEAKRNLSRFGPGDPVQPAGGLLRTITGTLRRSVDWAESKPSERLVGITDNTPALRYASRHEFGDQTMPARPFMRRAVSTLRDRLGGIYERRFREVFGGGS